MKVLQQLWNNNDGWKTIYQKDAVEAAQLVFVFGGKTPLSAPDFFDTIQKRFPTAEILTCTTSGEIMDSVVHDNSMVVTAVEFEHTQIQTISINLEDFNSSFDAGRAIVQKLEKPDLNHIFLISDGQLVNGSHLVKGLNSCLRKGVAATGGLAGDGYDFNNTLVGLNRQPSSGNIVGVGFYGDRLQIGFGSKGGWETFGPERIITKSEGNVLFELDGQPALELYKKYLGEAANQLPSSALYFPLSIKIEGQIENVVRTILSVDEAAGSMTFAGDIPEGSLAKLMRHNVDQLIDGAETAAEHCIKPFDKKTPPDLAILVSCVGRKIVLGQNIDEEVEVVKDMLGNGAAITGFYSYGEIAPFEYYSNCELHNQTMTITTFTEK